MEAKDIKIGKWYMIKSYGFDCGIKGKVVDVVGNIVIMKFYWGNPYRTRQAVDASRIIGECRKPSLFSNR